jgi:hypothetical protein
VVDIRFFQAAAVVIPTLLIALGLATALLPGDAPRARRLRGGWGLWGVLLGLCLVLVAELLALIAVAADEPARWAFIVVLGAIALLLAALASVAVQPLVGSLAGTWLESVEILLFFVVSTWAALALSIVLLD